MSSCLYAGVVRLTASSCKQGKRPTLRILTAHPKTHHRIASKGENNAIGELIPAVESRLSGQPGSGYGYDIPALGGLALLLLFRPSQDSFIHLALRSSRTNNKPTSTKNCKPPRSPRPPLIYTRWTHSFGWASSSNLFMYNRLANRAGIVAANTSYT